MKTKILYFKNLTSQYAIIIKMGLLTATTILFFKVVSLFVLYQYIQFDVYLSLVAILFFLAGIFFNRRKKIEDELLVFQPNLLSLLSAKELQVLMLLAEGKTNKEIAAIQFIEVSTVKTHINHIYTKLSVSNRKEARTLYNHLKK